MPPDDAGPCPPTALFSADPSGAPLPERLGPYRILAHLGAGGFGNVYLAEQVEPFYREVAVKQLKAGMDSRQVLARFDSERQALALMDHPNIARMLESGLSHDGRPYFAMELVRGAPLTTHCDQQRLTTDERIDLFISVCDAIQHAHQKGVIHRDIKPTNILVEWCGDDRPLAKVIDFGIAKALGRPLTRQTLVTHHGEIMGSPDYMSPEQAGISPLDIDTRSDIYSLGVLFYQLLVGAAPFDFRSSGPVALPEILRRIREEDPPRPSVRLAADAAGREAVAGRHRTRGAELHRALKGDLDWITMRAMAKDRRDRYQSASELAADLARYRSGAPVTARPPTLRYRLDKFCRQQRSWLALGALGAALVVACALVALQILYRSRKDTGAHAYALVMLQADLDRRLAALQTLQQSPPRSSAEALADPRVRDAIDIYREQGLARHPDYPDVRGQIGRAHQTDLQLLGRLLVPDAEPDAGDDQVAAHLDAMNPEAWQRGMGRMRILIRAKVQKISGHLADQRFGAARRLIEGALAGQREEADEGGQAARAPSSRLLRARALLARRLWDDMPRTWVTYLITMASGTLLATSMIAGAGYLYARTWLLWTLTWLTCGLMVVAVQLFVCLALAVTQTLLPHVLYLLLAVAGWSALLAAVRAVASPRARRCLYALQVVPLLGFVQVTAMALSLLTRGETRLPF